MGFCRKMYNIVCSIIIHGFFFFLLNNAVCTYSAKKKRIMEFARFIEFVGVIKAEALSKHTLHVKVWWFHNYQKIGPSPRECSVQISQLFWFLWSPLTSLIINYCTPVRFSFFLFSFLIKTQQKRKSRRVKGKKNLHQESLSQDVLKLSHATILII